MDCSLASDALLWWFVGRSKLIPANGISLMLLWRRWSNVFLNDKELLDVLLMWGATGRDWWRWRLHLCEDELGTASEMMERRFRRGEVMPHLLHVLPSKRVGSMAVCRDNVKDFGAEFNKVCTRTKSASNSSCRREVDENMPSSSSSWAVHLVAVLSLVLICCLNWRTIFFTLILAGDRRSGRYMRKSTCRVCARFYAKFLICFQSFKM